MGRLTRRWHSRLVRPKWTSLESPNWLEVVYSLYIFIQRHTLTHLSTDVAVLSLLSADRSPVIFKRKRINYQILPTSQNCHPAAVAIRQVARLILACTSVHLLNLWSSQVDFLFFFTREQTTSLQAVVRGEGKKPPTQLVIEPVSPRRPLSQVSAAAAAATATTTGHHCPLSRPIILVF